MSWVVQFSDGFRWRTGATDQRSAHRKIHELGLGNMDFTLIEEGNQVEPFWGIDMLTYEREGKRCYGIVVARLEHPEGSIRYRVWEAGTFRNVEKTAVVDRKVFPSWAEGQAE